jgi:hypothetical protein
MYQQVVFPNNPHQLVAPYWADADTRSSGNVWYFQSTEPALLTKATKYIQRGFVAEQEFQPTHLFVATWDDVGYFQRNADKVLFHFLTKSLLIDLCVVCSVVYKLHVL